MVGAVGIVPSVIAHPVLPAGRLIAALVPEVVVPVSVTLPVYVAVGLLQAIVKLYVPGAPVAGAPVTVLVIVTATLFLVSGLVMVPVIEPPGGSAVAAG